VYERDRSSPLFTGERCKVCLRRRLLCRFNVGLLAAATCRAVDHMAPAGLRVVYNIRRTEDSHVANDGVRATLLAHHFSRHRVVGSSSFDFAMICKWLLRKTQQHGGPDGASQQRFTTSDEKAYAKKNVCD
jgi:hypothetical protein